MLFEYDKLALDVFLGSLVRDKNGCWLWLGNTTNGYGYFQWKGCTYIVHRLMWEYLCGPIPQGMILHHRCEVKICANDEHLELITQSMHMALHRRLRAERLLKSITFISAELIEQMEQSLELENG